MGKSFVYLACPYKHSAPLIQMARYDLVTRFAAALIRQNIPVYSPITHGVGVSGLVRLPEDHAFWKVQWEPLLRAADSLIILAVPGWGESEGVSAEIKIAQEIDIPISFFAPVGTNSFIRLPSQLTSAPLD